MFPVFARSMNIGRVRIVTAARRQTSSAASPSAHKLEAVVQHKLHLLDMAMGLENFPDAELTSATAMWANMLFWAFLLTTLVYLCVGVTCAISMRLIKKGVSVGIALFFLLYAELRVICGDAIACAFIAGIYTTSGWSMSSLAALGWGAGLSAISISLTIFTSLIPVYAVL